MQATTSTAQFMRMSMLDPALRRKPDAKPFCRTRLYLDSANVTQWELWMSTGLFFGENKLVQASFLCS